ncbi:hypothetical protein HDV02_006206 [Globomyces sp. JEL0801]|nr:hypothetical protein HDV02_006206 [Globomyces sp. JEL0801]
MAKSFPPSYYANFINKNATLIPKENADTTMNLESFPTEQSAKSTSSTKSIKKSISNMLSLNR